eukprot:6187436-Pleurochrysis_carterae.AAC.11
MGVWRKHKQARPMPKVQELRRLDTCTTIASKALDRSPRLLRTCSSPTKAALGLPMLNERMDKQRKGNAACARGANWYGNSYGSRDKWRTARRQTARA